MNCLFIISDFDVGGITASLCNLSNVLIRYGHKVTILNLPNAVPRPTGFHQNIEFIQVHGRAKYWNLGMASVKKAHGIQKGKLLLIGTLKKILNHFGKWESYVFAKMPELKGYDMAVGFRQCSICYYVAAHKTDSPCKVGFWHVDIAYAGDISGWDHYLSDLDRIACVSDATRDGLVKRYPFLYEKAKTVYNIFDDIDIKNKAKQFSPNFNDHAFHIITVSRIEFLYKQLNIIPEICQKLKSEGLSFIWYIVGDGPDRSILEKLIAEKAVSDCLKLLGTQSNPFPYVRAADLFVLTSKTESYGMVITESLILGTPVIAGDYPALKEIIENGVTGIITPNSSDDIYQAISCLIKDKIYYQRLKSNCMEYTYTSHIAYEQFISLLGGKDA